MLTLRNTTNYELRQIIPNNMQSMDSNCPYGREFNRSYIPTKNIGYALAPVVINGLTYSSCTLSTDGRDSNDDVIGASTLASDIVLFNKAGEKDQIKYVRVLTHDPINTAAKIVGLAEEEQDFIFEYVSEEVQKLYDKCLAQTNARNEVDPEEYEYKSSVLINKEYNSIVECVNYDDTDQASDIYLTIGLLPILIENLRNKLDDAELDYFKKLVRRSQVKRINNAEISAVFEALTNTKKYRNILKEIRIKAAINALSAARLSNARNTMYQAQDHAQNSLEAYSRYKKQYYEAQDIVRTLENNEEQFKEEVNAAISLDAVRDVTIQDSTIYTLFETTLSYYDEEEASLVLDNKPDSPAVRLFKEIFIEQKYKLHVVGQYQFSFGNSAMFRSPGSLNTSTMYDNDALFNPHIQYYSCLGDYQAELRAAQAKGDLLIYNNLCVSSLSSLNFRDGTVINRFLTDLNQQIEYDYENGNDTIRNICTSKCLEDKQGNRISIRDWYKIDREEGTEA